jgi:hypothetical protein
METETYRKYRVSDLAWSAVCFKRARIQSLRDFENNTVGNKYTSRGIELHKKHSMIIGSFDRRILKYKLFEKYGPTLIRRFDNIEVRGRFDNVRVLLNYKEGKMSEKVVSIIEEKSTSRKYLTWDSLAAAKFQLQLYIWIMTPLIEELGFKIHSRHYVEVYRQDDDRLISRIMVKADPMIQMKIDNVICAWQGLEKMRYPELKTCKSCPKNIRAKCNRWVNIYGSN